MKFQFWLLALLLLAGEILTDKNRSEPIIGRSDAVEVSLVSSVLKEKAPRRVRRMSCEALSYPLPFGYYNHAACASFCFLNGKNFWGHCQFGWCKCR